MTILDSYVDKNLNTLEKVKVDETNFKNKTTKKEMGDINKVEDF